MSYKFMGFDASPAPFQRYNNIAYSLSSCPVHSPLQKTMSMSLSSELDQPVSCWPTG